MVSPIFRGRVSETGVLQVGPQFEVWLSTLKGKEVDVVVREKRTQRSNKQNRAYFGIVVKDLADHLGYTKDECHDALKIMFASRKDEKTGLTLVESTSKMNTKRFIRYYEDIQRWAAEFLGYDIPSPNEYVDPYIKKKELY